jgi:hypothetical protein
MVDHSEIAITATAKSKTYRMMSAMKMRDVVERAAKGWNNQIYRKASDDEYHVLVNDYAVVVRIDGNKLVVVTQMHQHEDYEEMDVYNRVNEIGADPSEIG